MSYEPLRKRALPDFDRRIGGLERNLVVSSIAEWTVGGSAAAAKGEPSLARQVVLVAIGVHEFDNAVGILDSQRTVLPHHDRDL